MNWNYETCRMLLYKKIAIGCNTTEYCERILFERETWFEQKFLTEFLQHET